MTSCLYYKYKYCSSLSVARPLLEIDSNKNERDITDWMKRLTATSSVAYYSENCGNDRVRHAQPQGED